MRTLPSGRRLAACGLTALAGLLLIAATARPATAGEGVVRISDRHAGAPTNGIIQTSHHEACATDACAADACGDACGSGCQCGPGCKCGAGCCGKKGGLLGRFFGKRAKDCRCGSGCPCGRSGSKRHLADLNGDGQPDPIGHGICRGCGSQGPLYGHGFCPHCCGFPGICLPGVSLPGVPCLGLPCLGGFAGQNGAIGGCYSRVYALNPYYHDFRDGAVYAAQGYNAPIAVPLAPNVDYQWNYGWGIPSSRITPVSRVVPSPYAVQPQYAVPPGYAPASAPYLPAGPTDTPNGDVEKTES